MSSRGVWLAIGNTFRPLVLHYSCGAHTLTQWLMQLMANLGSLHVITTMLMCLQAHLPDVDWITLLARPSPLRSVARAPGYEQHSLGHGLEVRARDHDDGMPCLLLLQGKDVTCT